MSLSPEAERLLNGEMIPESRWLQITGRRATANLGQTPRARLVVSALDLLREGSPNDCDIENYE